LLRNLEYWKVGNLELTNDDPAAGTRRYGVLIQAENCGTMHGIHLNPPADIGAITVDPLLVAAGSGGTGLDSLKAYQLKAASPCIGSAVPISSNVGKDFWGNPVRPDGPSCVGAHEIGTPVKKDR
jgi:hypothetical protein